MPEHHSCTKDHRSGVGAVGAHYVAGDMATSRLKQCIFLQKRQKRKEQYCKQLNERYPSDVTTWDNTRTSDQSRANVGDDSTIQVRHHHNVKLARSSDELH